MACLGNGDFASMTDARLDLPQDWCRDNKRCGEAKIPVSDRTFKTKADLAYDIVLNQLQLGTEFDFIGADGFYGNDAELADKIGDLGCLYISNQQIF